jgi:hypothetical protein
MYMNLSTINIPLDLQTIRQGKIPAALFTGEQLRGWMYVRMTSYLPYPLWVKKVKKRLHLHALTEMGGAFFIWQLHASYHPFITLITLLHARGCEHVF